MTREKHERANVGDWAVAEEDIFSLAYILRSTCTLKLKTSHEKICPKRIRKIYADFVALGRIAGHFIPSTAEPGD